MATVLSIAKFVATFSCYGFGGLRWYFLANPFFGGMIGMIIAGLLNLEFVVMRGDFLTLAVVGLVNLHDLLRTQTMMAQRSKEDV